MQIIIASSTTTAGTFTRVLIEWQKEKVPIKRILLILFCSIIVGYVNFEAIRMFDKNNWHGISSILLGMISVDLVLMFVKRSLNLIFKKATDYFKVKENE